jgi:hypothetical protein
MDTAEGDATQAEIESEFGEYGDDSGNEDDSGCGYVDESGDGHDDKEHQSSDDDEVRVASKEKRDPSLQHGFFELSEAVDAVKWLAAKEGKGLMTEAKKRSSKSVVLGCVERLGKNKGGTCPVSVRITKRRQGQAVARIQYPLPYATC